MKKLYRIIKLAVILSVPSYTLAQTENQFTQYFQLPFLFNPAMSGMEGFSEIKFGSKIQWTNYNEAPRNYVLSGNHSFGLSGFDPLKRGGQQSGRIGLGVNMIQREIGAFKEFQAGVSTSLHLPISERFTASLGANTSFSNSRANVQDYRLRDYSDRFYQDLLASNGTLNYMNLDLGFLVYSSNFYIGYSTLRVARNRFGNSLETGTEHSVIHTALVGYNYALAEDWGLLPTVLVRYESPFKAVYSFNLKAQYQNLLWGGIGYSPDMATSFFLGFVPSKNLSVSYSYDLNLGPISNYSTGSHEIILGVAFFNPNNAKRFIW